MYQNPSEEEKSKKFQYAHEQYWNLSEEKIKKHQYICERYLPEDEKQRLV